MNDLYERDVAAWAERQADALRRRAANEIDWDNVADEIESLARRDRREIHYRLEVLCTHLLKWAYQPEQRSPSWRGTIIEQRNRIANVVEESPSLAPHAARLEKAYADGRRIAQGETGVAMPERCPWTIAQVLDNEF
jgi:hypothetical protein